MENNQSRRGRLLRGKQTFDDRLPPMPDLGSPEAIPHPDGSGAMVWNTAMVVTLARDAGTPQSVKFYRAFVEAWDRVKDMPGSECDKQTAAAQAGASAVGARMVF